MDLRDTSALVTGAGRGLGRALAIRLARHGARVTIVARNAVELSATCDRIHGEGGRAHAIVADIADKRAIHRIVGEAAAWAGPIDLLVNNASTLGATPLKLLLDTDCEDLERVLQVNLVAPFRLSKVIAGSMALRGRGVIVDISSDAAITAYPTWGAYSVSKAALDHLTRLLAAELEGTGVRLLAVDPGEMNTRMHADAVPDADPVTLADPDRVAAAIIDMLQDEDRAPSGARIEAHSWEVQP